MAIALMGVDMSTVKICYMKIAAAERQSRSIILENLLYCFDIFQHILKPSLFTLFEFSFTIAQEKLTSLIHPKYAHENTK